MMLLLAALPALVGVTLFLATLRLSPAARRAAPRILPAAPPLPMSEPVRSAAELGPIRVRSRRALQRAA